MPESHLPTESNRPNLPEYSVSELSQAVKRSIESDFGHVRVRGEVSGFKRHSSGHCYLSLKDSDAVLDAVIWRPLAQRLTLMPEDGMEVVCTGRMTTYASRSRYQLVIESVELAGIGALLKMLEERRKKLAAEGLFDDSRKRPLPYLPEVIGVVTSPTGAVIRDILHRLADRFPRRVLVWPVPVQGENAAAAIAAAIEGFNDLMPGGAVPRPDLLIVARGGGSLEDLMAFNEEIVVRAAAASKIPLISAVGHETDTTLIDYAADRRAPTPTAAAEMAVPVRLDLIAATQSHALRLANALGRLLDERRLRIQDLARGLPDPRSLLENAQQRLDDRAERLALGLVQLLRIGFERLGHLPERLAQGFARLLQQRRLQLENLGGRLESHRLSHDNILKRGYALARDAAGSVVVSAKAILPGAELALEFHDGKVDVRAEGGPASGKPQKAKKPGPGSAQGSLL
jgi:exodeoxyribonuclease VII large subunit